MLRGLLLAGLSLVFLTPSLANAQGRERVKITGVRLGFPSGPFGSDSSRKGVFKAGQWAPVYIDLECTRDTEERLLLVVETKDADDVITEGSVEIGAMEKGDRLLGNELGRIPYLKPGSTYALVRVKVKGAKSGKEFGDSGERSFDALESPGFVILGIGTNLGGLRLPSGRADPNDENPNNQPISRELRGGWVQTAQLIDVGVMPDQWIGYGAADLVVIGTGGDAAFWEVLGEPRNERKRKALAEWVRRGGRAILSVGTNPQVLEPLKELRDMLPATIAPGSKRTVSGQPFRWLISKTNSAVTDTITFPDGKSPFSVVAMQARDDRPVKTLVSEDNAGRTPVVVQGAYGLGRVTVVSFDLDRGPFSDWGRRKDFWDNLVVQSGYKLPNPDNRPDTNKYGRSDDDYTRALQGSLDFFEGVPVVSFGWVALFILIYIVLIGPVDYLFLKKVVKRLEWTWVTFPVIVVTVSAGAYFAAYALKGRDLKTNKVDVVDIDLAGNRVYGNTWFTLFSPRIQDYTIGLEPGGPTWTSGDSSRAAHDTVLSWQNTVERYRYGGGGAGGFFSKRYKYQSTTDPQDPNRDLYASGIEGVPIQVWTTKAFGAEWTGPIDPAKPPVSAELSVSKANPNLLMGSVTNHLPVESFTDAAIFWRGRYQDLGTALPTDVSKSINLSVEQNSDLVKNWISSANRGPVNIAPKQTSYGYSSDSGTPANPKWPLWPVLFSDAINDGNTQLPNVSLRRMDQSWRIADDRSEQAILVLRIATKEGAQAEDMARDPASPSRLWLGDLPTNGGARPSIQGTLKQETYIRVFIPVKQVPVKK